MKVSIQNRLLLTIGVSLLCLVLANLSLNTYFKKSIHLATKHRLNNFAQEYIKLFKIKNGKIIKKKTSPDNRFTIKNSGLYAFVYKNNTIYWKSNSIDNKNPIPSLPKNKVSSVSSNMSFPGIFSFGNPNIDGNIHKYSIPFFVKTKNHNKKLFHIMIYESGELIDGKIRAYSYALWLILLISMTFILIAQLISYKWSIRPLKDLKKDVDNVKRAKNNKLTYDYPVELYGVTNGFNDLLKHEQKQTERYKNSLSNLAHSFKTPLAVIHTMIDTKELPEDIKEHFKNQIKKMEGLVSYQLSTASRGGHHLYLQPLKLEEIIMDIIDSLEKIYKDKGAVCGIDFDENISYCITKGDFQELIGNLLENAFKWCKNTVNIKIYKEINKQNKNCLIIQVEDNGSGIKDDVKTNILMRGVRADEHVKGHGIGLSIVVDILKSYHGSLDILDSKEFGGACFKLWLPLKNC